MQKNIMKNIIVLIFFYSLNIVAQQDNSAEIIGELSSKIERSEKGTKLKWMDSLSNFIVSKTAYTSDSIVKATVDLALTLDSLSVATWQTANLIYYQNNIIGNPEQGNNIFLKFLPTARKCDDYTALAKFYLEGGDSYYFIDNHETSIKYYELAEENARKGGHRRFEGLAKMYKGQTMSFMGNFSEASIVLQEAARIFQDRKDTFNIISARNSLSILYSQNGFLDEAKAERDEAIILAEKKKSYGHLSSFYYNAATDQRKQGNDSLRIVNLKKALDAGRISKNPDFYNTVMVSTLAVAYAQTDSLQLAERYLEDFKAIPNVDIDKRNREPYVEVLKNLSFAQGNYEEALTYGKEHLRLKKRGSHYEEIQGAEKFLSDVYEAMGRTTEALEHFKRYSELKDSINSVQKVKALSYYQTLYETEKRDATIVAQKGDIALLNAENRIKNQWLLFGGLGFMVLFGGVVLVRSRNAAKRRQRMQEDYSRNLIRAQEEERTRVARELHDSVGQKLMLLTKKTKGSGNTAMESLAETTLDELRSISRGLHPSTMEKLGVTAAITSLINEVDANTDIFFTNEIENIDDALSKEASLHLYRIIQEVLNNMVKHSEARAASVTIEKKPNLIHAVIRDNGKGFVYSEKIGGAGTLGMKTLLERSKILGSDIKIESSPDKGTSISLAIAI
jgi:signal transduction histidine kinase